MEGTCNPSATPSAQGCHPCLRFVSLPMSPVRTKDSPAEKAGLKLLVSLLGMVPTALSKMTGKPCASRLGTSTGRLFRRWEIK
jgi:hypothetical protein